jgi:hypothetical protein
MSFRKMQRINPESGLINSMILFSTEFKSITWIPDPFPFASNDMHGKNDYTLSA